MRGVLRSPNPDPNDPADAELLKGNGAAFNFAVSLLLLQEWAAGCTSTGRSPQQILAQHAKDWSRLNADLKRVLARIALPDSRQKFMGSRGDTFHEAVYNHAKLIAGYSAWDETVRDLVYDPETSDDPIDVLPSVMAKLDAELRRTLQLSGGDATDKQAPPQKLMAELSSQRRRMLQVLWSERSVSLQDFTDRVWEHTAVQPRSVEAGIERFNRDLLQQNCNLTVRLNKGVVLLEGDYRPS